MANLLEKLKLKPRRFVAVDMDSHHIRLVVARRVGRLSHVLQVHRLDIPSEVDPVDSASLGAFLAASVRKLHLGGLPAVMALPRGQVVLKPIQLPAGTSQHELPTMVQYQMEKELPFRAEEAVVDFTLSEHFDSREPAQHDATGVLVAAVRLVAVEYYRNLAATAGLRLAGLALRPYADLACVHASTIRSPGETAAMIHVTHDDAEINILSGDDLGFTRSAVIKIEWSQGTETEIASVVEVVALEASRSLQSFQAIQRSGQIGSLLVAGSTGIEPELTLALRQRLGIRCEHFNPASAMGVKDDGLAGGFISGFGLALSYAAGNLPFDFINPKKPVIRRDKKKVQAVAASVMGVSALLALYLYNSMDLEDYQARVNTLSTKAALLQKENDEVQALGKRVESLQDWARLRKNWLSHWAQLSSLLPGATEAYVQDFQADTQLRPVELPGGKRVQMEVGQITFTIRVRDSKTFGDLKARLRAKGYEIAPKSLNLKNNDKFGYPFEMQIQLTLPQEQAELSPDSLNVPARPEDDDSARLWGAKVFEPALTTRNPRGNNNGPRGNGPGRTVAPPKDPAVSTSDSLGTPVPVGGRDPRANQGGNLSNNRRPAKVTFDDLKQGNAKLDQVNGQTVQIRGLVGAVGQRFVLREAPAAQYECFVVADRQNKQMTVLAYVAKDSPLLAGLKKMAEQPLTREVRIVGKAIKVEAQDLTCPAGIIVERIR